MLTPKKRRNRRSALPKTALPAVIDARTPAEAALVAAHEAATKDRTQRAPTLRKQKPDGALEPATNDGALWRARLAAAFGVRDLEAQRHLISQVASVFRQGTADENANAAIALIHEIAPRNGVEALLVAQMVAVHNAALEQLRRMLLPGQPAHFGTLTAADEWSAERLRREFLDGWVRRVAWHARNPVPWFAVIEKGPIGGRAHLHTLVAGTSHVSTEVLEAAWQIGDAQVRAYEPHRHAAFYIAKSIPDGCEWYDLSRRRAPLLEHVPAA